MSISYTNEEVVDRCIQENFKNNSIKHLKYRDDWPIEDSFESILEINTNKNIFRFLAASKKQDEIRLTNSLDLIQKTILKFGLNLNCKIIISTNDGVSDYSKYTRACYSCSNKSNHIQIPDPHFFRYLGVNFKETPFKDKTNRIFFIGSDTGPINKNLTNQRVDFCFASSKKGNVVAKISNFFHFNKSMLADRGIPIEDIRSGFVEPRDQLKNKFILNIDGNTSSWDRIPWSLGSDSLLISLKSIHKQRNWYYPFIQSGKIITEMTDEEVWAFDVNNFDEDQKRRQKAFHKTLMSLDTIFLYMKRFLIRYNKEYNS
jgi:hypothetical protein